MIAKLKSLQEHKGFVKYFKNTSWLFGEKILRMVVGLFVGIWVARYLGPEQFGLFSYAQSFVGLFAAIATLGLDGIVVRELVKDPSRKDELIGTAFWLKLIGAVGVLLLLAIAVNFTSNDIATNIIVFIVASATVFQAFNVVDFYFQAKVMSKYIVFANVISLLISSIVKIVLILNEAPLVAFAWTVLFDSFVLACGFIYFYLKNRRYSALNAKSSSKSLIQNLTFNKSTALSLLKDSWPLILAGSVVMIYMKIDQVMIKEIINAEAVGQYAVATRLSEIWYIVPTVIVSSLFPAIINAKKESQSLYYARLQKLYDLMVWSAIGIAIVITFSSDWIVMTLYGIEYNEAASVLVIHIWTTIFAFIGVAFGKYLIIENLTKKTFYRTFLGATSNILFNYILIPKYGINGAAIATLLSQFLANYVYDFFDKDLRHQLRMKTMSYFPIHILKGYKNHV